eukprot:6111956-Pyramimonas_sp.AAC.1
MIFKKLLAGQRGAGAGHCVLLRGWSEEPRGWSEEPRGWSEEPKAGSEPPKTCPRPVAPRRVHSPLPSCAFA